MSPTLSKPPPGYTLIPGGKHGGYRKWVGNKWVRWYPPEQRAQLGLFSAPEKAREKTEKAKNQLAFVFDQPVGQVVQAARESRGDNEYVHHVEVDPKKPWTSPDWTPELESYDHIVVNSSGGKDSQAQLDRVVQLCDERGIPRDRIVVMHADLGQAEWDQTKELAKSQADHYGLRFEWVEREAGDLLEQVRDRHHRLQQRLLDAEKLKASGFAVWNDLRGEDNPPGLPKKEARRRRAERIAVIEQTIGLKDEKYPRAFDPKKRARLLLDAANAKYKGHISRRAELEAKKRLKPKQERELAELRSSEPGAGPVDFGEAVPWPSSAARYCTSDQKTGPIKSWIGANLLSPEPGRKPRILNCLGIRAQESPARAKKTGFSSQQDNSKRSIDRWYPIFGWSERKVWDTIADSKTDWHKAYAKGMSRLSCVFCVFAPQSSLVTAALHNPDLFERYLELEREVGYDFSTNTSLSEVAQIVKSRREELSESNGVPKTELSLVQIRSLAKALGAGEQIDLTPLSNALTKGLSSLNGSAKLVVDWKNRGCCVHLQTADQDHHVGWYPEGAEANAASLLAAVVAGAWSVALEESGMIPPQ